MPRIYIASKLSNLERVEQLWSVLEGKIPSLELSFKWAPQPIEQWEEYVVNEYNGVISADIFLGVLPGGKGMHTELGIAICTVPIVIVLGQKEDFEFTEADYPSIFYFLSRVKRYTHDGSFENQARVALEAVTDAINAGQPARAPN